ncbi:hypothetical protein [uncultured Lamprocystis sp.]|uniref:hypothetical protein n=1 Tax=uncultured Lamprocystis sp. TaxID=543132 RepID=UPI0025F9F0DE|nr:hypothetical protein [uncultured Lamprocystis sp.]
MTCLMIAWGQHERELRASLVRRLGDAREADDSLQDLFIKALGRSRQFCEMVNSRAWLLPPVTPSRHGRPGAAASPAAGRPTGETRLTRTLTEARPGGIVAASPVAETDHEDPQAADRYPDLRQDPRGRLLLRR